MTPRAACWRSARFGATMLVMELAAGVILDGHYRLSQMLGRGGMGEVWEAEHTRLPKRFAIKFLLALSKAEPELLLRFKREAEIASRLAHPSIVQVTDFNILPDGTAYIAMERLVGEDLRARLGKGPLPLSEVREITRQVGSALALAHREGIVHRDLKPENIFLTREPDGALRAKVLDFGISKLQGAVTGTRDDRVLGTPGYMAPEQALGKNSTLDGRTDLFSLATIVYEMLTGEGVFMGDTLAELCTKVLFYAPPPLEERLPAIPRQISAAVAQALAKEPNARQRDIATFADQVTGNVSPAAVSGFSATVASDQMPLPSLPVRAREPTLPAVEAPVERASLPAPSHPAKRRMRGVLGASVAVLVLVGGATFYQLRGSSVPKSTSLDAPAPLPEVPPKEAAEAPVEPPPETKPAAQPERVEVAQPEAKPSKLDPGALTVHHEKKPKEEPKLPASVQAALDDAEHALDRGDAANAIRLARNSLREANSERAYLLMARAYCGQHDVGMVQAMMRNLSTSLRKQVRDTCQRQGLTVP